MRDEDPIFPRRPIIGVTGPDHGGESAWWFSRLAVWMGGGHAVRITPLHPRAIETLEGLILGGGADVDPKLYDLEDVPTLARAAAAAGSAAPRTLAAQLLSLILFPLTWLSRKLAGHAKIASVDPARDALEMNLLAGAVARGLPVLGICRGAQLINVFFSGSLHRSLAGFYVEDSELRTILPLKRVTVVADSNLSRLLRGRANLRVNALHRQAISRLGSEIRVAATDRNSIVQAVEHARLRFVLGVQWHPEYLPQLPEQRALVAALVAEARYQRQAQRPKQQHGRKRGSTDPSEASPRRVPRLHVPAA
jgi:putative glutamine amidotransferase